MIFLLIIGFTAVGIAAFSVSSGALLFGSLFLRKKDTSSLDPAVIAQALDALRKSADGTSLRGVEMSGASARLAAHLNDKRIMIPLLEAKLRWFGLCGRKAAVERLFITGFRRVRLAGYAVEPEAVGFADAPCSALTANGTLAGNDTLPANGTLAGNSPRRVALLVHGYSDSAAGMAYLAEEYLKRGVTVVAVDCRAHGGSGGKLITMGYTDASDVVDWLAFLTAKYGENTRFILHGVSMGAAAVLQSLSLKEFQPFVPNVTAAVADCGFSSAKEQLACQIGEIIGAAAFQRFIGGLVINGMSLVNGLMSGFFLGQDSPVKALRKRRKLPACRIPLVLFHGDADVMVSPRMANELETAAAGCGVSVAHVPDAPHIGSYFYDPQSYMRRIFDAIAVRKID
ncbi:alpha/beta hydrolase [Treponema brennaborense]|uniref:AB hydrolase-1 domain-containing protein n=1 Tax=Treponema brennaborense (strain DSM 12168 / CIP 105900 / DD5/3) TaxID=906968 RepID=F4LNH2_TREBD|nr:alpha/beta hydrolase [Treponema brennaborense]AEE17930.1 hypothetical protein Trebr_2524 [Treponema brennaborense DSM 12168]